MFYAKFVQLCNEKGVSQSAAARGIGLDKSAVTRWSKGSVPRGTTLYRLAEYFGVPVSELLGEGDSTERTDVATTGVAKVAESGDGLEVALEALRNQPGRRALLSVTKNMTEAQVLRFADWLADVTGGNKD